MVEQGDEGRAAGTVVGSNEDVKEDGICYSSVRLGAEATAYLCAQCNVSRCIVPVSLLVVAFVEE